MKYGKLIDNKTVYIDTKYIVYNKKVFVNPSDEILRECDIYPIYELKSIGLDYIKDNKIYHHSYNDIEELRQAKLAEIDAYDTSSAVNSFTYNGLELWIPRETRVSLLNSTAILLKHGIETATLWQGKFHFELPCNVLLEILDAIEIYALQCFNKTAEHKATVMDMTNAGEIMTYDYTLGYPEKLNVNA